jgi:diguanylate cyclase (GGDEF)-like protein
LGSQTLAARQKRVNALSALGAALACSVLAFGVAMLIHLRDDAWAQAIQLCSNVTVGLAWDIERNVTVIDQSLKGAIAILRAPGLANVSADIRQAALFGSANGVLDLGAIGVTDANGNMVLDSDPNMPPKLNVADRDYFRVHQAQPDIGLYIGLPFLSRGRNNDPSIGLSRRRMDGEVGFSGVVNSALRLRYFTNVFARFNLGAHGFVSLVRADGRLILRHPAPEAGTDKNLAESNAFRAVINQPFGTTVVISPFDGVERLVAYRKVGEFPLVIVSGLSVDEIYAPWRKKALVIGPVLLTLWGATITLCLLFRREMRRRLESERALAEAADELAVIAAHDGLTGLANRRSFESRFAEEWRRAHRGPQPLGLLMVDADNFKLFNDEHGHPAGDRVLQSIAGCIAQNLHRAGDLGARYGGEEFVMLLPATDLNAALLVAERVRSDVEALGIPHAANPSLHMTVSIGVAVIAPQPGDAAATLLKWADDALYDAKRAGRNRVHAACQQFTVDAAPFSAKMAS